MNMSWWLGFLLVAGCATPYKFTKNAHEVVWFCIPYCGAQTATQEQYCWNVSTQTIRDQEEHSNGCGRGFCP